MDGRRVPYRDGPLAVARYAGAWSRGIAQQRVEVPPTHGPRDPEHLNPTPEPEPGPVPWRSTVVAPGLPGTVVGGDPGLPAGGGFGPVYEPQPGTTVGRLPGVTQAEASVIRGQAHGTDDGSVAARHWEHSPGRDGSPNLDVIRGAETGMESPQTLQTRFHTGVESPLDPGARRKRREQRWYDRYIDRHFYDPQMPPKSHRQVKAAPPQFPPRVPTHRDSPYPTSVTSAPALATQDRYVDAQSRTAPVPAAPVAATSDAFGLGSWGA